MAGPKILHLDIETAPDLAAIFTLWNQFLGIDSIIQDWYILCYSAMWEGDREVLSDSLVNYPKHYAADPTDDSEVLKSLHALLDEADIVVGQNGDRFDLPKINARFLIKGMKPPSPYQTVDTLKVSRRVFKHTSNKLDYVARILGLGAKQDVGDKRTWIACMNGDLKAWDKMVRYNRQDVRLLAKVYRKLLPWINNHPNHGLYYDDERPRCPKCGSHHIQFRGTVKKGLSYRRFQCQKCGGWGRERVSALTTGQRKALLANT